MKLTTRGRFAVTSMIDLALYGDAGPVRLSDIARRQQISVAYLEQIFCKLRRAELVQSVRGPGGGYRWHGRPTKSPPEKLSLRWKVRLMPRSAAGAQAAAGGAECLAHGLWSELNDRMAEFLNTQTLSDIRDRYEARHAHAAEAANESPVQVRMPAH